MSEKKPRQLFKERYNRVMEAIALKEPDRVPLTPGVSFYPTEVKGISKKEAMYDLEKSARAFVEVLVPLNWDLIPPLLGIYPGELFDIFGVKFFKWPGALDESNKLNENLPFQYVEREYMKAEEYDEFFYDPTGFMINKILPRLFTNLEGFSQHPVFPSFSSGMGSIFSLSAFYGMPHGKKIRDTLEQAGQEFFKYANVGNQYENEVKKLGYPTGISASASAPYDVIGDNLRGMRGIMLDMFKRPEELKKMINMFIEPQIANAVRVAKMSRQNVIVFMALHRGADGFMSLEQFEEFYWPSLVRVMEGIIKEDLIPMPFFEGSYNDRLKYLEDFAQRNKGKFIYWFDKTDIAKAKQMFGDHACIRGNIPGSLLIMGNPSQVEDYVKKSIEDCAEGGGYLVDGALSGIPDEAKPENVKAMTDAVFKYGIYRK